MNKKYELTTKTKLIDGTGRILCTDPGGREMTTTPMITFPPLTDCDGNPEPVLSVTFAVGPYSLEITTDGAGAYLTVEVEGRAKLNPDELTALAAWVESVCKTMDKHNREVDVKR